jgi:uncharacterized protein (TIGR03435 family)
MTKRTSQNKNFAVGFLTIAVSTLFATSALAQAPPAPPKTFEVASVHISGPDNGTLSFPDFPSAHFNVENMSMTILIAIAYGISDNRITAKPDWLDSTFYSVHAKPEGDAALTEKQYQPLLQQFLKDRFKLSAHLETRQVPGYTLVVAKGGSKLTASKEPEAMAYILPDGVQSAGVEIKILASLLSRPLGHPVVDKTGLTGSYKLDLKFAPATATESDLPSIFTAVEEQLGLKLEAQKVPEEILVIDHIDKIPSDN